MKLMNKYLEFCEIRFFCPQSMTEENAMNIFLHTIEGRAIVLTFYL